jgi:acyl-CoA synthetase (AMP-forming)/AMP-acid ligase II
MSQQDHTIIDLLRISAEKYTDNTVFVSNNISIDYGKLQKDSEHFAQQLVNININPGDRIGLVLDRCYHYIACYYGVIKAGAVIVPICPDTSSRELNYYIQNAGIKAVILESKNAIHLRLDTTPSLKHIIFTDNSQTLLPSDTITHHLDELLHTFTNAQLPIIDRQSLASIVYTSGTTGKPKGVKLSHINLAANTLAIMEYLTIKPDDIAAMVIPYYYVYGNSVLHTHIAAGAAIAQIPSIIFSGQAWQAISDFQCTSIAGVPSTFAQLFNQKNFFNHTDNIRYITQAGAAMSPSQTRSIKANLPNANIFIMYGQTEATSRLTYLPPEQLERKIGSVGIPVKGVTITIEDNNGNTLSSGDEGTIVAQGDNIMMGYWEDPKTTAKTLINGKLYTGDIGYLDNEGYLFIKGRQSDMIKSGGHKISPQEIENVLSEIPGIAECAVVGIPHEILGQSIAAYIVPKTDVTLEKRLIMHFCLQHLPRFKLPSSLLITDQLPKTKNGKLKRSTLITWKANGKGVNL